LPDTLEVLAFDDQAMAGNCEKNRGVSIGVISDTHGHLDSAVKKIFEGVDLIVHAGDIGKPDILDTLQSIAPVKAVRGNMDWGTWTSELPPVAIVDIGNIQLYVLHDIYKLDLDPQSAGLGAVISGHTHKPSLKKIDGVLYVNPGSASQPRFNFPATIALIRLGNGRIDARIIELNN
jgi:putative phosphoesterase